MTPSVGISGLPVIPSNHILSHLTAKSVIAVNITPKAAQDITLLGPICTITGARFENHSLEIDVGYVYNGGEFCAFSDLQRSNGVGAAGIPEVHIYLDRTTPKNFRVKGMYCKDTLKIPLDNACFGSPVSIHMHYRDRDESVEKTITKKVIMQIS